jgi:hypothetical protein
MTEEEHRAWVAEATKAWPETKAAGNDAWADYFRRQERKQRDYIDKSLEDVVYAMGKRFAEERTKTRARLDAALLEFREELVGLREANAKLVAENERLMKQHPRLVKTS